MRIKKNDTHGATGGGSLRLLSRGWCDHALAIVAARGLSAESVNPRLLLRVGSVASAFFLSGVVDLDSLMVASCKPMQELDEGLVRGSTAVLLNAACSKAPPVISAKAVLAEGGEVMTSLTTLVSALMTCSSVGAAVVEACLSSTLASCLAGATSAAAAAES